MAEFRIAISPTEGFFRQAELFNFSLRRLGGRYATAPLRIFVGGMTRSEAVAVNRWSDDYPVEWISTPDGLLSEMGYHANTIQKYAQPAVADVVVAMDADTVFVGDVDDLIRGLPLDQPTIAGHMAHGPPADFAENHRGGPWAVPDPGSPLFWPWLFDRFDVTWPEELHSYSIRTDLPPVPAYFNGGLVAWSAETISPDFVSWAIAAVRMINQISDSYYRLQITKTLGIYRFGVRPITLPAAYNAANDHHHLTRQSLEPERIRVIHYLRERGFERQTFLTDRLPEFLLTPPAHPLDAMLVELVRDFVGPQRSSGARAVPGTDEVDGLVGTENP